MQPQLPEKARSEETKKNVGYVVLFLICASFVLIAIPSVVEAANYATNANVTVNPYIVGVGQKVEISMRVTPPPPIVTSSTITESPLLNPMEPMKQLRLLHRTTQDLQLQHTYPQIGTFHAQFFFQGEFFNSTGDIYGGSSSTSTTFIVQQNPVNLLLTTVISGSGSTNPAAGVYGHSPGDSVLVSAQPASGWTFDHWLLNGTNVGSSNPYNLTMFTNRNLTAAFTQLQYRLNTSFSGSGNIYPASGTYQYPSYTVVNVSATPNSGWTLSSFMVNGVNVSSVSPYYLTMDSNKTLTAVFTLIPYSLNITVAGSGTTNPGVGIHQYTSGTNVSVNANVVQVGGLVTGCWTALT